MGKKLLKGTLVGGVIVYVWMMISWMLLPWHCTMLHKFKNEEAVAQVIRENAKVKGIYTLPNICEGRSEPAMERMKQGAYIFASVQPHGKDFTSAKPYLWSFFILSAGAFLITYLLLQTRPDLEYWSKVWFVTLVGLIVGILGFLPSWNWWGFSAGYVTVEIADLVISWFLAGLGISAVTRK